MKTLQTKTCFALTALTVLILVGLAVAPPARAFKIDFLTTFVPLGNVPHAGQPIHEDITRDALTSVTPGVSLALVTSLQRGVQNTDIIHQFDSESHFDNSSVSLNVGFANGFTTLTQRFQSARQNAVGNPEFLAPHYTSFLDIATDVAAELAALAADPACLAQPACPTAQAATDASLVTTFLPGLAINPNPDPHRATSPSSLFYYPAAPAGSPLIGYLGFIQEDYLDVMGIVNEAVTNALGNHFDPSCLCNRSLVQVLGASNAHVVRLQRLQNALRAYRAFQDLGHALHAAQDFFAHSDYVEIMAGVSVGQAIAPRKFIPLPADFAHFNLPGLQAVMGTSRFNLLESGDVFTIWLGEGDYSLGDAGILNLFNPDSGIMIGGVDLFGLPVPPVAIPALGRNPNPFPGFNHGHYLSSTALGLNKDMPSASAADEPAHRNFLPARQAAVKMSALLWTAFLQSIGQLAAPIRLTCPPDKTVSTDPGQCYATGVALGAPSVSGGCETPGVTNAAPAQFVMGTNLVRWTAKDSCGNSNTCTQRIVVVDREAPRIVCSTNRMAAATSSSGVRVVFPAPAVSDNCPGDSVVCVPRPGSAFPIGTTTVLCTALDASGNRATCSFTVRVKGAAEQIQDLMLLVGSYHMHGGTEKSLTSPLQSALDLLSAGKTAAASEALQTFIDHVQAQSGKKLTDIQTRSLLAAATQIKTVINGASAGASETLTQ